MKPKALFSAVRLAFPCVANDQFANDDGSNLKNLDSAKRTGRCA